jgi:hypothetical protein
MSWPRWRFFGSSVTSMVLKGGTLCLCSPRNQFRRNDISRTANCHCRKRNGELLHRDAVAAEFADAHILEWAASIPASRPSAADADISLLSDDLLAAIGRQWQN